MRKKLFSILALLLTVSGAWSQSNTITVYFTDALGWHSSHDVCIYCWNEDKTVPQGYNQWPGQKMTLVEVNENNENVYSAEVPANIYGILFNNDNNGSQTEDITSNITDGAWWYSKNDNGIKAMPLGEYTPLTFYVVGSMNNWTINSSYLLQPDTETDDEYYINNKSLAANAEFKVVSSRDGQNPIGYYPGEGKSNYKIDWAATYTIKFRPKGNGGTGWHEGNIKAEPTAVTLDETDTNIPGFLSYLNDKTVDVTLNRTLKTGGWNTFCAPFNTAIPAGWTVRELTGASYNNDNGKQLSLTFGGASSIEAGKPYLVKVSSQVTNPVFTGVTVNKNPNSTTISGIVSFIPVMSPTQLATDKTELFITVSGGKSYLTYPSSASSINGFRAYFKLLDEASGARVFNLDLDDDDATGISLVLNDETTKDNGIYLLDGRRVQGQPTQKGVYIVNGKKRIIK